MKKLLHAILFHLGVSLGPYLIHLLGRTWRIRWIGEEHMQACRANGHRVIFTVWHGRLLPLTFSHRNRSIQILISRHRDGEIIRRITSRLGFGSVRGSTGKEGTRAILEMVKLARRGHDLAITPDGPRGPRCEVQGGVVLIAQRARIPILPLTSSCDRGHRLRSWDRFEIPAPFARLVIGYASPIHVPADAPLGNLECYRLQVQHAVAKLTAQADRLCGRT